MRMEAGLKIFVLLLSLQLIYCSGRNTLVLVDDLTITSSHSVFFSSLQERGYTLDIHKADDNVAFQKWGKFLYDNLILFAPTSNIYFESDSSNKVDAILEFIDQGGNVLIATGSKNSKSINSLVEAVGVKLGEGLIIDHFNYDISDSENDHSLIISDNFVNKEVFGHKSIAPVLYRGVSLSLLPENNLVFPLLKSSYTSYTTTKSSISVNNNENALVAALQARNNARVAVIGSLELCSDAFINQKVHHISQKNAVKSGNREFSDELSKWVFQEKGLIRIKNIEHHRVGETEPQAIYTVMDNFYYAVEIEEYDGKNWIPYVAKDVQLEFQMLDPYVRRILDSDGNGKFSTTFKIPDVYGVFTLRIDYYRIGYSALHSKELVTIRPFRHNEYERFIPSAFPYYASAFSMMAGVALFSVIFLFQK